MTRRIIDIGRFVVSLGLTLALGAVALGQSQIYHVVGTVPYPPSLPNDFEIIIDVTQPAVVGAPYNFQNLRTGFNFDHWGPPTTTNQAASFTVRWAGPPMPALVIQPVTFGFDFTSDASVALNSAWWTINGQRISEETGFVTVLADVPEPSTFVLAALSLAGLGCVALRKKYRRA